MRFEFPVPHRGNRGNWNQNLVEIRTQFKSEPGATQNPVVVRGSGSGTTE